VVVAEALLVDCCVGESDVSSLIKNVLGIFERFLGVLFYVCRDAQSTVANVGREHRFYSE
jgi:hypothetical protein